MTVYSESGNINVPAADGNPGSHAEAVWPELTPCLVCGCRPLVVHDKTDGLDRYQYFCDANSWHPHSGVWQPTEIAAAEDWNRLMQPRSTKAAKADIGKPRLSLVPPAIIEAIGIIRTYGTAKYGDPDNWRQVEPWRYKDAMMRHQVVWMRDDTAVDAESGYPHSWHMACNLAFLIAMEMERGANNDD